MSWDSVWESIFRDHQWGRYPSEDLVRFVANNFYHSPNRSEVSILELGCGPGSNLWFCAREGFSVYGIDGSETAVQTCRERLNAECPGWKGRIEVADFSNTLCFPDKSFDAVIDCEALSCNNFETSLRVYQEARRVLKPDGLLFVRTFADSCFGEGTGEAVGYNSWLPAEGPLSGKGQIRFTTENDIKQLLSGFSIMEMNLLRRSWMGHASGKYISEWLIVAKI